MSSQCFWLTGEHITHPYHYDISEIYFCRSNHLHELVPNSPEFMVEGQRVWEYGGEPGKSRDKTQASQSQGPRAFQDLSYTLFSFTRQGVK